MRWWRALLATILFAATVAHAGDPRRVYKTIESDHFVVSYYEPLGDVARRIAVAAEHAHATLAPALDHQPVGKTLIDLTDDTDGANGLTGVTPRNQITLYATAPSGFTELDDYDDWIYGLVAHEYTHVLHLDTIEGAPTIYNRIFGKTWAPNQIMPRWVIEGIAVYEESKRSAGGRIRGTWFDDQIRIAQLANNDLRLDEVSGAPRRFPRGNAAYMYGSHFLTYIFDRFGDDTVRAMSHEGGGYAPPFAVNRQIAKVVGKPFTELYDDWKDYTRDKYAMQEMAAARRGLVEGRAITHTAETNALPHYSADGRELYWHQYDGYTLPRIRAVKLGGDQAQARDVVQIDAMGDYDLLADGSVVFEQGRLYRGVYAFEDLFRWDAKSGQVVRLTRGRRARNPAASPDGRRLAYSQNEHAESVLAVMDLAPDAQATIAWRGQRYDQAYEPAWSPDGTRIAFSAWRRGGFRDILVVDLATRKVDEITHDRAMDLQPSWSSDGSMLYFSSDRTGIANIYAFDLKDRTTWQVTNVLGGAFEPRASADGTRLAFIASVSAGGYDLFELPLDRTRWLPARDYLDDRPAAVDIPDDEFAVTQPRPYRALETLAPPAWTAQLDSATKTANIQTGGADAAGLHAYSLAVGLDLTNGDTNVGAGYGYFRFMPALRVAGSRTLVERGGWRVDGVSKRYKEEDYSGTVSVGIPIEARPSTSWNVGLSYDVDWFRLVQPPAMALDPNAPVATHPATDYVEAGIGTRLSFSTVRGATYGLGLQNGFDGSVSIRYDHPALGSAFRFVVVSYTFDRYQRLWGTTPTLYMRAVGAFRAGDQARAGAFSLGGVPAQDVVRSIVDSTRSGSSGYLRGYPGATVRGNQFHLINLEYRQELWQIEHGLQTLPVYLRRLHMGVLCDAGTAFDAGFSTSRDLRASLGGALRMDAYFGYFVPGTFEIGYARGLTDAGINETWFLLTGSL